MVAEIREQALRICLQMTVRHRAGSKPVSEHTRGFELNALRGGRNPVQGSGSSSPPRMEKKKMYL